MFAAIGDASKNNPVRANEISDQAGNFFEWLEMSWEDLTKPEG